MLQHTTKTLTRTSLPRSRAYLATRQLRTTSRQNDKDTAFDPQTTKPEEQKDRAAEELTHEQPNSAATPEASPADPKSSSNQPRNPQEGGSQGSRPEQDGQGENPAQASRSGPSGGGSPPKAGGGNSGGGGGT